MSTRFYFQPSVNPEVSVPRDSSWTLGTQKSGMAYSKNIVTGFTSITTTPNSSAINNIINAYFVSLPLAAQTLSGNLIISGQLQGFESNIGMNAVSAVTIKVVSNDGATEKGKIINLTFPNLTTETEYPTTVLTNKYTPSGSTITGAVSIADGERLVFEIGARQTSASSNRFVTQRFGYTVDGDLPLDQTSTAALSPWIDFSQTILFKAKSTKFMLFNDESLAL